MLIKKQIQGYGGVAIQKCILDNQDVTVLYGHLELKSITSFANELLLPNQQIGILGLGYSTETNGERKHLHLSIHKGTSIELRGYVEHKIDRRQWMDIQPYLGFKENK